MEYIEDQVIFKDSYFAYSGLRVPVRIWPYWQNLAIYQLCAKAGKMASPATDRRGNWLCRSDFWERRQGTFPLWGWAAGRVISLTRNLAPRQMSTGRWKVYSWIRQFWFSLESLMASDPSYVRGLEVCSQGTWRSSRGLGALGTGRRGSVGRTAQLLHGLAAQVHVGALSRGCGSFLWPLAFSICFFWIH
jgi:hypothetical protein